MGGGIRCEFTNGSYNLKGLKISVVIPSRRDDPQLQRCLDALLTALPAGDEVILVGDGWVPVPVLPKGYENSVRVLSVEKSGPAACRDYGARHAAHDWLCFVDSDVLVHEDAIVKSISILTRTGDAGLIGSYDDKPEDPGIVSRFRNLLHHYHHQRNAGMAGVFWGAFGIVRKSAYLDAGGFDPSYRDASVEDIDLGYRLAEKGYRVVLRPEVQVTHLKRWTLPGMIRTDILLRAKPWTLLLHRYRNRHMGNLNTSMRERLSAAVALTALLSLFLALAGLLPLSVTGLILFVFIILQWGFYAFITRKIRNVEWPFAFLLHQVYFLSAVSGWLLARFEVTMKGK
jgi:GT2 family glycosyltransferase